MCNANAGHTGCGLGLSTHSSTTCRKRTACAHTQRGLLHIKEAEHPICSLELHISGTHTHYLADMRSTKHLSTTN